ncbi:MFS transporter [Bartonella sp. DGB2]|uniref:MFS transporter n=1 Tax=Bartonella sp. DGB2 TaxID=3388426 RepID=UPI00398FDCF7
MSNLKLKTDRYAALFGICIASFLGCIDLTVVNTIIPAIGREFAVPLRDAQWTTSVFMVALSAFMVPVGAMADIWGRKRLLLLGLVIFGVSSLLVGIADSFLLLIVFRFIQGIGCAILYTVSGAIISYMFNQEEQGKALGILFAVNGIGLAIGPVVGGFFSGLIEWRYAFLINIPFILLSLFFCFKFVDEKKGNKDRKMDVFGCITLILALISLIGSFSMSENEKLKYLFLFSIFLFCTLFFFIEKKSKDPLVEFQFFKNNYFLAALISTFFLAVFYSSILLSLPMLLANVANKNDLQIGFLLLPATCTFAISSAWVGHKSGHISPNFPIFIGLAMFVLAAFSLGLASKDSLSFLFFIGLILFGTGWGAILGPATLVALQTLPNSNAAVAMGTSWTIHNIGGACGAALTVSVITNGNNLAGSYQHLMFILSGMAAVIGLLYYFMIRRPS